MFQVSYHNPSPIILVPKKSKGSSLNDYRPIALTSVVIKVFERLVINYLKTATESHMDAFQFAYQSNRSVEDAVTLALHYTVRHLESPNTCTRILFVDFSSAFNTIIPHQFYDKLRLLNVDIQM